MIYLDENNNIIIAQCEKCNTSINIDKRNISRCVPSGYYLKEKLKCSCNEETLFVKHMSNEIICPKCGFNQIVGNKQGFGLGKAIVGGTLFGGAGLLGGFIGSNKIKKNCLKCGHRW